MEKSPNAKIPKATLYKMVSYKGVSGGDEKHTGLSAAREVGLMKKDLSKGFSTIISGVNSLGASLNSIALGMSDMTASMKTSVSKQIKNANKVVKIQEKALDDDKKREKQKISDEKRRRKLESRNNAEDNSEKPGLMKLIGKEFAKNTKKSFGSLFSGLVKFAGFLLKAAVGFAALTWLAKNPDAIKRLAKTLAAVGKFILNVSSFLAGSAMDGLLKFLENPVSLKGLIGAVQFIASLSPLLAGIAFLGNPVGTIRGVAWVISTLGKSIAGMMKGIKGMGRMRVFARNKFARLGLGAGTGVAAAFATSMAGGDPLEAVGAGVGAGAGSSIGMAIGQATNIPGMGMALGAAGGFLGGKAGAGIGKMLKPLTEPIGKFFNMVGDSFNAIMKPIQDAMGGFFQALGDIMTGILDFVEPHMPMITKILQIGVQTLFGPLFLGMKALTAVLKFFGPKKKDDVPEDTDKKTDDPNKTTSTKTYNMPNNDVPVTLPDGTTLNPGDEGHLEALEKVRGMMVDSGAVTPMAEGGILQQIMSGNLSSLLQENGILQMLGSMVGGAYSKFTSFKDSLFGNKGGKGKKGGWINGPQSGYPVSLGGMATDFIGHGLEWVGQALGGKNFVIPFDTPATRKDKGLTSRRISQAMAGGYQLPSFAEGGEVEPDQLVGGYTNITTSKVRGLTSKQREKVRYAIDINHLHMHKKQILEQLPEGTTIEDIIKNNPIDINPEKLHRILESSDAHKASRERSRKKYQKMIQGMSFSTDRVDRQGEFYASIFNKITGVKDNIGDFINDAKLAFIDMKQQRKDEANKVVSAPPVTAEPIVQGGGGGGGQVVPITSKKDREADPYLISRFGLVSEFNGDVADLM